MNANAVSGNKRRQDEYASQSSMDGRGTKSSKQSCASSFTNQYSYVVSSLDPECSTKQYRVEYHKNKIRFKTLQTNQSSLKTLAQDHQNGMLTPYQWIDLNGTGTDSGAISFAPLQTTGSDAAELLLANANKKYTDLLQKKNKEAGGDYPGPLLQSDYVVDGFRVFVFYLRPVKENRQRELALLQNTETGLTLKNATSGLPKFIFDLNPQDAWTNSINSTAQQRQSRLREDIENRNRNNANLQTVQEEIKNLKNQFENFQTATASSSTRPQVNPQVPESSIGFDQNSTAEENKASARARSQVDSESSTESEQNSGHDSEDGPSESSTIDSNVTKSKIALEMDAVKQQWKVVDFQNIHDNYWAIYN